MAASKLVGAGVPIGVNDRLGRPIHIGDRLSFDEKEWGGKCEFVIELRNGQIEHNGCTSDLSSWCTIIENWDGTVPGGEAKKPAKASGKLKVFRSVCDSFRGMPSRPNGSRQAELMMCAASKAEFGRKCDALGLMYRKTEVSEIGTANCAEIAKESPGIMFWKPLSDYTAKYQPIEGQ